MRSLDRTALSQALRALAAIALVFIARDTFAAEPADLSPAEKIYADLANLPADERKAQIEAGARKEGAINIIQTLRDALGNGQIELFQKRYPFLKVDWTASLGSPEATERLYAEETAGRHLTDAVNVAILDFARIATEQLSGALQIAGRRSRIAAISQIRRSEKPLDPHLLERPRRHIQYQPRAARQGAETMDGFSAIRSSKAVSLSTPSKRGSSPVSMPCSATKYMIS